MGQKGPNSSVSLIGSGFQKGLKILGKSLMAVALLSFSFIAIIASPLLFMMYKVETSKP